MAKFEGVVRKPASGSVRQTADRLESALRTHGVKIFARIDQAAEAKSAGLEMHPMELLIFGNPKGGTPLMQAIPEAGLDLPLKVLVWEDAEAKVWVSWNDPGYLQSRYAAADALIRPLAVAVGLIEAALK